VTRRLEPSGSGRCFHGRGGWDGADDVAPGPWGEEDRKAADVPGEGLRGGSRRVVIPAFRGDEERHERPVRRPGEGQRGGSRRLIRRGEERHERPVRRPGKGLRGALGGCILWPSGRGGKRPERPVRRPGKGQRGALGGLYPRAFKHGERHKRPVRRPGRAADGKDRDATIQSER